MSQELWTAVDRYIADLLVPSDPALEEALPDLPGCVAAGDDLAETKALMEPAIEMHLRGMRRTGILFP